MKLALKHGMRLSSITLLGLLAFALNGCLYTDAQRKAGGALDVSRGGGAGTGSGSNLSSCSLGAFAVQVYPSLKANCAGCHAGAGPGPNSVASPDIQTAYNQARARTDFGNPRGSLMFQKSSATGHGGSCGSCGPAWGDTLIGLVQEWAKAEAGTADCSQFDETVTGDLSDPDNDYSFINYPDASVSVNPAVLATFRTQVHNILESNCVACHVDGGIAGFAPFAAPYEESTHKAYKAAKSRLNVAAPANSLLMDRGGTPNHGPGCVNCGTALANLLRNPLTVWAAEESAADQASRPRLVAMNVTATGTVATLQWDLGTSLQPANADLAGARFRINVRISPFSNQVMEFTNPVLLTGGNAVAIADILIVVNGMTRQNETTYASPVVNTTVPAFTSQALSTAPLNITTGGATASISFSFGKLKKP